MTVTIVQALHGNDSVAETSKTYSLSGLSGATTQAGSALIVAVACVTKTRTVSSITDSASNSGWVHIDGGGGSTSGFIDLWWNPNPASTITSFTTNFSGTSKAQVAFLEVTGLSGTVDVHHSTNHTAAATTAADAVTTTNASDWILAGIGAVSTPSSVASPFTVITGTNGSGQGLFLYLSQATETSTGTYTATFTQPSQISSTAIAAFKAGNTVISGTAAGTITITGAGAGTAHDHVFSGAATGAVTFTGAATGHITQRGTASGSITITGTAGSHITENGVASGSITFTGSAAGVTTFRSLHNDFESGQSSGTTITTGNSGVGTDNAFDTVTGAIKYSSAVVHNGTLSALTLPAAQSNVHWGAATLGSKPVLIYGRVYVNMSAVPTTAPAFVEVSGDQHSNILRITGVSPGGTLKVVANDGTTSSQTLGSVAVALNQWVRIEWQMSFSGGSAVIAYQLFNTPESLTPDENINVSRAVTDTFFTDIQIGPSSSPSPSVIYLDDLALSNNATPGPAGSVTSGTAAGTVSFTGAAAGHITEEGAASSTITITGLAAGHTIEHGVGTGSVTFTGAAAGTAHDHVFTGTAAGTVTFTGSATGHITEHGTASGSVTFTGSATGEAIEHGAATGSVTFTGLAAGTAHDHVFVGSAAGSVTFTGTAAGHILEHGTAAGTVTFTGAAAGTAHDHVISGTAAGTVSFTGSAAGHEIEYGTAGGTITFTGLAAGTTHDHVFSGTATGVVTFTGAAAGTATDHLFTGSASGTVSFTGTAAGHVTEHGTGTGVVTFTGLAAGEGAQPGAGHGIVTFTGVATGRAIKRGSATGVAVFTGSALAEAQGSAAGTVLFTGNVIGSVPTPAPTPGFIVAKGTMRIRMGVGVLS